MYRHVFIISSLLLWASLGMAQQTELAPYAFFPGSPVVEKTLVTAPDAEIFTDPKEKGSPVAQGSIFYRLTVDGKTNDGMYKVGTKDGKFAGWLKNDAVVSIPSFAIAAPIGKKPLELCKSMDSEDTVSVPSETLPFIVMNPDALKKGYLEVVCIPLKFPEKEIPEPDDSEAKETIEDEESEVKETEEDEDAAEEDETVKSDSDDPETPEKTPAKTSESDPSDLKSPEETAEDDSEEEKSDAGAPADFVFVIDTTSSNGNLIEILNLVVQKIQNEKFNVRLGLVEYRDSQNDFAFDAVYSCPLTDNITKFAKQTGRLKCENDDNIVYVSEVFSGLKMAVDDSKWLNENKKHIVLFSAAPSKDILFKEIMGDEKTPTDCDIKTAAQMKKYLSKMSADLFVIHNNISTQKSWGGKDWRAKALGEAMAEIEQLGIDDTRVINVNKGDEIAEIADKVLKYIKNNLSEENASESSSSTTDDSDAEDAADDESIDDLLTKSDDEPQDESDQTEKDDADENGDVSADASTSLVHGYIKIYDSDNEPLVKIMCFATRDSLEKFSEALYSAQRTLDRISSGRGGNIRVLSNNLISETVEFLTGDSAEEMASDKSVLSVMEGLPSEFSDGVFNVVPYLKSTSPKVKNWRKRVSNWYNYTNDLLESDSAEAWSKFPNGVQYRIIDLPGEE